MKALARYSRIRPQARDRPYRRLPIERACCDLTWQAANSRLDGLQSSISGGVVRAACTGISS